MERFAELERQHRVFAHKSGMPVPAPLADKQVTSSAWSYWLMAELRERREGFEALAECRRRIDAAKARA